MLFRSTPGDTRGDTSSDTPGEITVEIQVEMTGGDNRIATRGNTVFLGKPEWELCVCKSEYKPHWNICRT